jgi:hypothetical protein
MCAAQYSSQPRGAIVAAGAFKGSLDYWLFNFKNPIASQGGTYPVATFFGTNTAPLDFCGVAGYERWR